MPDLESEKSAAIQRSNQSAKRLKILTPNQIINRLSIALAQMHARNTLKNLKMKSKG